MLISKTYYLNQFIEPISILKKRTNLIEKHNLNTKFTYDSNKITRQHKFLKSTSNTIQIEHIKELSITLDSNHNENLTHGDIHPKNLIVQNQKIHLIDWEPDLKQIIGNKATIMYTPPWIDPIDFAQKKITINTDLLCYFKLIHQLKPKFFKTNYWDLIKQETLVNKNPFIFLFNQKKDHNEQYSKNFI